MRTSRVLFLALLAALLPARIQAQALDACDLNSDGHVNILDVQLIMSMVLGLSPCTANINGDGVCNVITAQRVINSALGGACVTTGLQHGVDLNWTASTGDDGGSTCCSYNVYRSSVSGGPYTKVNTSLIAGVTYTDSTVQPGQAYYYVATAVDTSGNESVYSDEAPVVIPTP